MDLPTAIVLCLLIFSVTKPVSWESSLLHHITVSNLRAYLGLTDSRLEKPDKHPSPSTDIILHRSNSPIPINSPNLCPLHKNNTGHLSDSEYTLILPWEHSIELSILCILSGTLGIWVGVSLAMGSRRTHCSRYPSGDCEFGSACNWYHDYTRVSVRSLAKMLDRLMGQMRGDRGRSRSRGRSSTRSSRESSRHRTARLEDRPLCRETHPTGHVTSRSQPSHKSPNQTTVVARGSRAPDSKRCQPASGYKRSIVRKETPNIEVDSSILPDHLRPGYYNTLIDKSTSSKLEAVNITHMSGNTDNVPVTEPALAPEELILPQGIHPKQKQIILKQEKKNKDKRSRSLAPPAKNLIHSHQDLNRTAPAYIDVHSLEKQGQQNKPQVARNKEPKGLLDLMTGSAQIWGFTDVPGSISISKQDGVTYDPVASDALIDSISQLSLQDKLGVDQLEMHIEQTHLSGEENTGGIMLDNPEETDLVDIS